MAFHVTKFDDTTPFAPAPDHHGVEPRRLQGGEVNDAGGLVVTFSTFGPGARVDAGPVTANTVYVVLQGSVRLGIDGVDEDLGLQDSVHFPAGTVRSVVADAQRGAVVLVVRNIEP